MATLVTQKDLTEKVRVALIIEAGKIKPVWFEQTDKRSRERIQITKICSVWSYREGATKIICFAVWDGVNTYSLSLNTLDFTWRLGVADFSPY